MKTIIPAICHRPLGILMCGTLLWNTACTTLTSKSGYIDGGSQPGRVRGQLYYLPRAQVRVTGLIDSNSPNKITVTIKVDYVPDNRYRYSLDPTSNVFYEDDYKLYVDANGLLETATMVTEDKTGAILGDIAKIGASVAKFAAGIAPTDRGKGLAALEPAAMPEPFDYTFFLDEVGNIKPLMRARGFDLDVVTEPAHGAQFSSLRQASNIEKQTEAGVVFRPVVPCRITVTDEPFRLRLAKHARWGEKYALQSDATSRLTTNEIKLGELRKEFDKMNARETELLKVIESREKEEKRPSPDLLLQKYKDEMNSVAARLGALPAEIGELSGKSAQLLKKASEAEAPAKQAEAEYRRGYGAGGLDSKALAEANTDGALLARMVVPVPDEKKHLLIRMGRTPFVKRTDNIVFTKGLLTKVEGTRPSPVLGFLQIPKTILETIVPLPLDLRTTRVNNINQQRTLDELLAPAEPAAKP